jgi:hypothetical protein
MKSKRSLMTALVGLAMLATPIAAAAKDHGRYAQNNGRAERESRSFSAPERNFNKHQFRNGQAFNWTPAPAFARQEGEGHEWRGRGWGGDGDEWRGRGWGGGDRDEDRDDYQNYGNRGYYGAPYYGGGYAGGNSCRAAQSLVTNYWRDRNTGHPAAAASILRQNQWAFRSGCAGGSSYNSGLFGGLGGYGGAPAYSNYGGYNSGYNGGYNNGYNGGYGQPYGGASMLAPLLQQFVR